MTFEQGATRRLHKKLKDSDTWWDDFLVDDEDIELFLHCLDKGNEVAKAIYEWGLTGCSTGSCEGYQVVWVLDNGVRLTEIAHLDEIVKELENV